MLKYISVLLTVVLMGCDSETSMTPSGNSEVVQVIQLDVESQTSGVTNFSKIPNQHPIRNDTAAQIKEFYDLNGGRKQFSKIFQNVSEAVLYAEDEVAAGDFAAARARIDDILEKYPEGKSVWRSSNQWAPSPGPGGWFASGYYSVKALDRITKLALASPPVASKPLTLSVVIARCINGSQPVNSDLSEYQPVTARINPRLLENDYYVVRQAYQLYQQNLWAITRGERHLELEFDEIEQCVDIRNFENGTKLLRVENWRKIVKLTPVEFRDRADMFLMIFPTLRPTEPPLSSRDFITGGMAISDGRGPFIADDYSFLQKRQRKGGGRWTDMGRRIYFPTWNSHEYSHSLFKGVFKQYALETTSHSFYKKASWPSDFVGKFEADFHYEAMTKRFDNSPSSLAEVLALAPDRALSPSACTVELYEDSNYEGKQSVHGFGTHSPRTFRWNQTSSIKIPDGLVVTACRTVQGTSCEVYRESQPQLSNDIDNRVAYIDVAGKCDIGLSSTVAPNRVEAENISSQFGTEAVSGRDGLHEALESIDHGDFSSYNVDVIKAGVTTITVRASSGNKNGGGIDFILDGASIGSMVIPYTGGWNTADYFKEFSSEVTIPKTSVGSKKNLTLQYTGKANNADKFILNWIEFGLSGPVGKNATNIALNKPTKQSSTSNGGASSRAVDGITAGDYADGSVSQTHPRDVLAPAWWEVDLGEKMFITDIILWSRTDDCCDTRLRGINLLISDTAFDGTTYESNSVNPDVVQMGVGGTLSQQTIIPVNTVARYVRIQLSTPGVLSLAEVQVMGGNEATE